MPFDWISEAISRFIGALHLETEGQRARDAYEAFRNRKPLPEEPDPDDPAPLYLAAPHQLIGFTPTITFSLSHNPQGPLPPPDKPAPPEVLAPDLPQIKLAAPEEADSLPPLENRIDFVDRLPLPPQVLSITQQRIMLSDDDDLIFSPNATFLPHQTFRTALTEAAAQLQTERLEAFTPFVQNHFPATPELLALVKSLASQPTAPPASHIRINGHEAEALPELAELVPAYWKDKLELKTKEELASEDSPNTPPTNDPFDALITDARLPEQHQGHQISTGGNLAANEAIIRSNAPDAGVIVVGGDLIRLDMISQIGALAQSTQPEASPSRVLNAAQIALPETAAEAQATTATGLPETWVLQRITGDVVFSNRIEQHIFASDLDRLEAVLTADSSQISMGGNMVSVNAIEQIGLIYDADQISGAGDLPLAMGDNLLLNLASITHMALDEDMAISEAFVRDLDALSQGLDLSLDAIQSDIFAGLTQLTVLYIEGDLVEQNIIQQITHLGDSDQLHLARLATQEAARAAGITLETGGNLLVNSATIIDLGRESMIMAAGEAYSAALIHQAGLIDPEALPTGARLAPDIMPLAPEVVAFLAPDLPEIDPDIPVPPLDFTPPEGLNSLLS